MEKSLYKVMMLSVVSVLGITTSYGSIIVTDDLNQMKPRLRSGVRASQMMDTDLLKSSNPTAATTQSSHGAMAMPPAENVNQNGNSFIYYFHKVHYAVSALFSRMLGWVWPESN